MKDALLEIYTEEIPARFIPPAIEQLKVNCKNIFDEQKLRYGSIEIFATPRRFAVCIKELNEKTEEKVTEIVGPKLDIAKDKDGNYTPAAVGFAKSKGTSVSDLSVKKTEKGECIRIIKKIPGEETEKKLSEIFVKIIFSISFPKTMTWDSSGIRFARPIRNIMALYGKKVIKLKIADVSSGNFTYGSYIISSKKLRGIEPDKYVLTLRNNYVIVDHQQRKAMIEKLAEGTIKKVNGRLKYTDKQIDEINCLVEYPSAVLCRFDERFLSLPEELLETCIKSQKFMSVVDAKGHLTSYCVGIRNGISEHQEIVREGYERVLTARLKDAEFFYNKDMKTSLESKVEKLKGVIFNEKLGTMYDKTRRVVELSAWICDSLGIKGKEEENIRRTASLCKADLVTDTIFEWPELEGIAGRLNAENDREPLEVSTGIEEHRLPVTADGMLPGSITGKIVSVADKIDTIVSDFAIDLIPTGSADPYGLRRQSAGILRILMDGTINVSLKDLIEKSMSLLPPNIKINTERLESDIMNFFQQRLETIFESKNYRFDEVRAVLATGFDNLIDIESRLKSLHEIRKLSDFEPLIVGYKRAANILKQAEKKGIEVGKLDIIEDNLKETQEERLYQQTRKVKKDIKIFQDDKNYSEILKRLVSLRGVIDDFFDKILVMADAMSIRNNRLALLKFVNTLFLQIADLSQLQ